MKILLSISLVVLLAACKTGNKKGPPAVIPVVEVDSFLITDSSWGLITSATDFEGLKKIYGEINLKDVRECDAECMDSIDVTKVFPGQKNEITVIWNDTAIISK